VVRNFDGGMSHIISLITRNPVINVLPLAIVAVLLSTIEFLENVWMNTRLVFLYAVFRLTDKSNILFTCVKLIQTGPDRTY
jgi:hypothetical protein